MTPVYGRTTKDCLRACLASILEKDYDEIPYVDPDLETDDFWKEYRKVFNEFGFEFAVLNEDSLCEYQLKGFSIGIGKAKGEVDHAVVCLDGTVVHDPNPASQIDKVEQYLLLIPMHPWKHKPDLKSKNEYITGSTK